MGLGLRRAVVGLKAPEVLVGVRGVESRLESAAGPGSKAVGQFCIHSVGHCMPWSACVRQSMMLCVTAMCTQYRGASRVVRQQIGGSTVPAHHTPHAQSACTTTASPPACAPGTTMPAVLPGDPPGPSSMDSLALSPMITPLSSWLTDTPSRMLPLRAIALAVLARLLAVPCRLPSRLPALPIGRGTGLLLRPEPSGEGVSLRVGSGRSAGLMGSSARGREEGLQGVYGADVSGGDVSSDGDVSGQVMEARVWRMAAEVWRNRGLPLISRRPLLRHACSRHKAPDTAPQAAHLRAPPNVLCSASAAAAAPGPPASTAVSSWLSLLRSMSISSSTSPCSTESICRPALSL